MVEVLDLRRAALAALRPPPKLDLATWTEANVYLPSATTAEPGRIRLWPHQRQIATSIGDPGVPRVSVLKAARVGYSQLLVAALGHYAVNDPGPTLVVLPAEADCRNFLVGAIEPTFAESPALRSALGAGVRNTILDRRFPGGSLKLVGANAPRNLRALTARVLVLDEIDGFEVDAGGEGDPVALAMKRTLTYAPANKIVMGSTPTDTLTSRICRAYDESDRRIFECPCPACGEPREIRWADIHWDTDSDGVHHPETACWRCPSCGGVVEDGDEKAAFIGAGSWRATRPEIKGHHGYRLSALVSLLPGASWPIIAREFLDAKRAPELLQVWTNTVLGEPWAEDAEGLDENTLAARVERFGLDAIPPEVLFLTVGVDVQHDRLEFTFIGHDREGNAYILGADVVWGSPTKEATWQEVDDILRQSWPHPMGGRIRVDAAFIDAGDGGMMDEVISFCKPRRSRGVWPIKGDGGMKRPLIERSKAKGSPLIIVGVDVVKSRLFNRLAASTPTIRFSDTLTARYFDEVTSERIVVRYSHGQPVKRFERIPGRAAEALDSTVYALAAREMIRTASDRREVELLDGFATATPPILTNGPRTNWATNWRERSRW